MKNVDEAFSPLDTEDPEKQRQIDETLKQIVEDGSTYTHIILFNAVRKDDVSSAIKDLSNSHSGLLRYHGFLAGFQFLGVVGGVGSGGKLGPTEIVTLTLLVTGFALATVGSIISFIALAFFGGIINERNELIIGGLLTYWKFFYMSDLLGFASTLCFLASVNTLIHTELDKDVRWIAWTANGFAIFMFPIIIYFWYTIILKRQAFDGYERHLNDFKMKLESGDDPTRPLLE